MRNLFLLLIVSFACGTANAQKVLLSQDVALDTIVPKKGPNRNNFSHLYVGYGVLFGNEPGGLKTKLPGTSDFRAGFRYKRRLSQTFALGFDLAYVKNSFKLKDTNVDKEKYIVNKAEGGFYLRMNYGKRGDRVGNFIDLGGSAGYVFRSAHVLTDRQPVTTTFRAKSLQVKYTGLSFFEDVSYSALMRVGFGRYIFYGEYRLSDVISKSHSSRDLPYITAGFQIGLHQ